MILGIYGTGGSGKELLEMISKYDNLKKRWDEIVYIDDTKEIGSCKTKKRMPFEMFTQLYSSKKAEIAIAVGEPRYRKQLGEKVRNKGYKLALIISPKADVSLGAQLGEGVVVKDNSIISSDAVIGENTWINSDAIIGHDVNVGKNCQISSLSLVAGRTKVGNDVYIGAAACVREDLIIGDSAILSMGAIVLKDVRDNKIVMGNPAREIAENKEHKVFR